ncbi:MAG: CheR family methyltransferase [Fimbriimonadaceae bacterium]
MLPKPAEWQEFYSQFKRKTGLDLDLYKANQLQRRIVSMVGQQSCENLNEYWQWLAKSPANVEWFLDRLAINVSELFRNPEKWVEMEKEILPLLLKSSPRLKIWSAGCSYGAEALTLAMILDKKFPGSHRIVGSDIDTAALNQAKAGQFSKSDTRCVPAEYKTYLQEKQGEFFADEKLRKNLIFQKCNLLGDRFDTGYDLIMCRNVVIYFTDEAKDELYEKFFRSLKPGGILFVGSTERISRSEEIGFRTEKPFYYQKPITGDREWRNAS